MRINVTITDREYERIRRMAFKEKITNPEVVRRALSWLFAKDKADSGDRASASPPSE